MNNSNQYINYIRNLWALPFVHAWLVGPIKKTHKLFPWQWEKIITTHYVDKSGWHYFRNNLEGMGEKMNLYFQQKSNLRRYDKLFKQTGKQAIDLSKKYLTINLKQKKLLELGQMFKEANEIFENFAALALCLDGPDEILQNIIKKELKKYNIILKAHDIFLLLIPNKPSDVRTETKDFHNLAVQYYSTDNNSIKQKMITAHIKKWWWIDLEWGQMKPMDEKNLRLKLKRYGTIRQINNIERQTIEKEKRQRKIKRKLMQKLPDKIQQLITIYETLSVLHDLRKEVQMKIMYTMLQISQQILQRSGMPKEDVFYLTVPEIRLLSLGKKIKKSVINQRKKYYWFDCTKKRITFLYGKKSLRRLKQAGFYHTEKEKSNLSFKGMPASPGKAIGRVRIGFMSHKLNHQIKKGEILVTGQTTPNFVPAMKKAVAIITDEGGITSHAAVVSRELGIPCIIGTKNATQVLKDGDLVEVDANKGIVKKIK